MAALHFGCIHFRQYLHGRTFTVWTDHKNLIQLQTIKSESTILNRLRTKLIGFDFKIIYKKGIFNQAADFLSRYPIENNVITTNLNEHQINIVEPVNLKILQARDNYLKNIITVLENSEIVDIKWKNKAKSYTLNNKNGLIYYKEKINGHPKLVLAIPEILTNEVIQNFHDNKMSGAHLGVHKVYNKIRTRYHWPLMHKQIKAYVTSCIHCQKRKPDKSKQVGKMLTYPIESGIPFSDVTIDYVGPLMPSRGFRYILVATCRVTKYCVAKACRNADAKSTTAFLLDLLLSYGAMKVVRSDNGTHFTAKVISDILTALNIKKTEGIAYRPTSQGGVEKQNQVIIDMIAPYMQNNEKWSDVLQIVLHAYNSAIHYSTGYSPFYLLHGYEPSSIFDIAVIPNSLEHSVIEELNKLQKVRNTIPEILKKAFENQKMNTDKNRSDIDFKLVGSRQKLMIINLYKTKMLQQPKLTIKEVVKIISKELGIGQRTAQLTIAEYKNEKTVRSPDKTKIRATFKEKIDDFERDAIRRKVHEFWFRKQLPTLDKILIAVNEDPDLNTYKRSTLHLIVRDLNFVYVKRGRNSALIEREDIVLWRTKYIEDIRKYRSQGRTIYYLDETWVNAGDCNERIWQDNTVTSHREAFVSEEGFVDGGLLVFESKKGSADYHEEMNGDVFFDWLKGVIPLLKDNSVIVMDNAPYHSTKSEKCPTLGWKKGEIETWLEEKGE
ncbi:hypothetical protein QTP88_000812 [Uroleucon formosanum]